MDPFEDLLHHPGLGGSVSGWELNRTCSCTYSDGSFFTHGVW